MESTSVNEQSKCPIITPMLGHLVSYGTQMTPLEHEICPPFSTVMCSWFGADQIQTCSAL